MKTGGKNTNVFAVLVFVVAGIGAVRWDDAHRTKNLDESPWVRAVAHEHEDAANVSYEDVATGRRES